jgi:hypothetical protein
MNYTDQWNALSSRIKGLIQAGILYSQFLRVRSSDSHGSAELLKRQCESVLKEIITFRETFKTSLPSTSLSTLSDIENKIGCFFVADSYLTRDMMVEALWTGLVGLSAFESELSFLLCDNQESIRTKSELAFHHLQRSIAIDKDFQKKWQSAFESGEVACEKLGAVHLLLHGIWAFKVNAEGARTDLVFQEPANLNGIQQYANGLVLTEWKKAKTDREAEQRFREAHSQAKLYSEGPLMGTELTHYRYAIVVSERKIVIPNDFEEDGVVYRHINIAVNPLTPSRTKKSEKI